LAYEQVLAHISFRAQGVGSFEATISSPRGEERVFRVEGDEWKLNAVQDSLSFRLSTFETRYRDPNASLPNAYDLRGNYQWAPIDSRGLQGASAFMPIADGAAFEVHLTTQGLIVRPTNEAASAATSDSWRP
jgi:hypothetical protein